MADRDLSLYRPNVGVVLFNRDGRVWLGRRTGTPDPWNWQFPQGGVDKGEDLESAARRELFEETGVRSVEWLGQTAGWLTYDFPPEILNGPLKRRGNIGQKQMWFAYRFTGRDEEVDLRAHGEQEFDAWRWADLSEAPGLIVPFKRGVYDQVCAGFARFARP